MSRHRKPSHPGFEKSLLPGLEPTPSPVVSDDDLRAAYERQANPKPRRGEPRMIAVVGSGGGTVIHPDDRGMTRPHYGRRFK